MKRPTKEQHRKNPPLRKCCNLQLAVPHLNEVRNPFTTCYKFELDHKNEAVTPMHRSGLFSRVNIGHCVSVPTASNPFSVARRLVEEKNSDSVRQIVTINVFWSSERGILTTDIDY